MAFEPLWEDGTLVRRPRQDIAQRSWSDVGARYQNAIKGMESDGGNYGKLHTLLPNGDRAYGAYGIMGKNIPTWTREVLGTSMTPQQFLASPKAQDAVFNARFGDYVRKYGPEGAARAWYGGETGMKNLSATDIHKRLTVKGYGEKFMQLANAEPAAITPPSAATAATTATPTPAPAMPTPGDVRASLGGTGTPPRPPANVPNQYNYMKGQLGAPGTNLVAITVPGTNQKIQVHSAAAPSFQGFLNDLHAAGAPLTSIGGHSHRNIAGTNTLSQHAYGNAIDINQSGRNVVSPAFQKWADANPGVIRDAQAKWGVSSGGDFRNPDFGHFEWTGRAPAEGATAVAAAPDSTGAQLATAVPGAQARAPAASGGTAVASTPPAAKTAPAATPGGQAQGQGLTLGQRIIKGMGPNAQKSLTTFVDPATGHEFITGSYEGQSFMQDVGRPATLARAMKEAVTKPAGVNKPAAGPMPDPGAGTPVSPALEDPEAAVYQRDVTPPAPQDPEAAVYQRNMTPPAPTDPYGPNFNFETGVGKPDPVAANRARLDLFKWGPEGRGMPDPTLAMVSALEKGSQPNPGLGLPPKMPDRLELGPPSVPPNLLASESSRPKTPFLPTEPATAFPSTAPAASRLGGGAPGGAPLDLSSAFAPGRVGASTIAGRQATPAVDRFSWVDQPQFATPAADSRMSSFAAPIGTDLSTSQWTPPAASSQAAPAIPQMSQIPQSIPWWMDPGWGNGAWSGGWGGWGGNGGGFGAFDFGGGGLGGGLSFGAGGW